MDLVRNVFNPFTFDTVEAKTKFDTIIEIFDKHFEAKKLTE